MRRTMGYAVLLGLGLSIVACSDDQLRVPNNGKPDLAGFLISGPGPGTADFAGLKYDLALPTGQQYGCNGLVGCYNACEGTSTTQTQFEACQIGCDNNAQSDASTKYDAALACGQSYCMYGSATGSGNGSYKCKLDSTQTRLVNMDGTAIDVADPGTGQKACGACLNDALSQLFGSSCTSTSSVDCEPSACISVTATCLADTP